MYPMFQTTKDLLYFVIAFCLMFLTFSAVWFLYYLIKIVKDVSNLVDNVKDKVEKTGKVIDLVKEKVDNSASHFVILVEAIKEILKFVIERKRKNSEKTIKKKKK